MSQTAAPLALSDEDRAELARWSQGKLPWLAERARIVLACAEPGSGVARVAAELGSTRMTVRKWRRRFAEEGLAGLADHDRPGHPQGPRHPGLAGPPPGSACTSRPPDRPGSTRSRWFGYLTAQRIRRGVRKSVQALEAGIRAWIEHWNASPRPFAWTKTADEILNSLAKYISRISGARY
jgi:hypothetical protein